MKKTWKFLMPVICVIIILGFFMYLLIPMLTGIVTIIIVVAIIIGLISVIKKFWGQ